MTLTNENLENKNNDMWKKIEQINWGIIDEMHNLAETAKNEFCQNIKEFETGLSSDIIKWNRKIATVEKKYDSTT